MPPPALLEEDEELEEEDELDEDEDEELEDLEELEEDDELDEDDERDELEEDDELDEDEELDEAGELEEVPDPGLNESEAIESEPLAPQPTSVPASKVQISAPVPARTQRPQTSCRMLCSTRHSHCCSRATSDRARE